MEVARTEAVDTELTRTIERRSSKEADPDEREELWQESVRAYNTRRRDEMRAAWCEYHAGQAERLRESINLRCSGFPNHTYPGRDVDLETMQAFHTERGIPPAGLLGRLWWRLRKGGG